MTESTPDIGWYADQVVVDEPGPANMWQPQLQTSSGYLVTVPVWFQTERECIDHILAVLVPAAARVLGSPPDPIDLP